MGFYGNITNTAKTQFQFDLVYPSKYKMTQQCKKDGVYIGRYVLVDYDADPNNTVKEGYRPGNLIDFKDGDCLYLSKNFENEAKITYYLDEYWDYDWSSTDVINGVIEGTVVRVKEDKDQYEKYENGKGVGQIIVQKGSYSFFECIGKITETVMEPDPLEEGKEIPVVKHFAKFRNITGGLDTKDNYSKNYEEDKKAFQLENIGRGWDSTVWQKVYENGEERYVMIAELNSVVPTFDIQADAPSMTPITPHFDEASTNVYYKLHWQPQWGMRTRAAKGDLKTPLLDKNGNVDVDKNKSIYTTSGIDLNNSSGETYPSDATTQWEKYEYDTLSGKQEKYLYNKNDQIWEKFDSNKDEKNYAIDAAIYWNEAGFDPTIISDTTNNVDKSNGEWDGKTDFINIKPTGWSGHQYSQHNGFKDLEPAPDTQELMVMLPSIGNAISKVWDIVYGDIEINNGKNRNLNINWENPEKNIERKGLRLIHDKYVSITEKEMAAGYQSHIYYKWNENINDYELVTEMSWPVDEKGEKIQLYTRSGAGQTYDSDQVTTLAGAINSVHDLMGMIIVDQDPKILPEDTEISTISSDRIYYYPIDGSYRIKDFKFEYTILDEKYFEYISAKDFYIKKYNIIDEKEKEVFKLTEKEFAPDMFYTFDGNVYTPLNEDDIFNENKEYYLKCLKVNNDEIFQEIDLDTFTNGWYKTSTGSYIYKRGGTIDDGVVYYDIDHNKLIDNEGYWPHVFKDGETYAKNIFYYKEMDNATGKQIFTLMDAETCNRNKSPFYRIPQESGEGNYPYVNSIENTNFYDHNLAYVPEDPQQALTWKGPYKPLDGYWDENRGEWVKGEYIYPTYFFNFGTFYTKVTEGNENVSEDESEVNGVTFKLLLGIPQDGYGYILDRPRTNTNMPQETPSYGNPVGAYRVKLIDYDKLSENIKSHLYYADTESYEEENELEDGTVELVKKTRFLKWIPVKKSDIEDFYKDLGYRKGDANSGETGILSPKKQIYYIESGEGIKDLYEENRYFYKVVNDNDPSYIRDRNNKFTENVAYYSSEYFTIGEDKDIYAIVPLGDNGEYYSPNKYYYYDDNKKEYLIDNSLTPRENIQYYKRNDIYISEDLGGFFQKGSSWNMNAEAIPHSVTLSKRSEVGYMKELESYGRNYNTINGLILELNRKLASDKPDTRDRSTLQGAINYLNDVAEKIYNLTPGDLPLVDSYGRVHGGSVETDEWIDVKIDPNADAPRMIVTHEYNPIPVNNTQHDMNGNGDTVSWPIYEYDDMGHMVGSAIHTETLPYNFKTIKVTNTGDNAVNGPAIEINEEGQIADNTQDTLTFSASNRWIKFDNNTEDTVKVGHLLSPFIDKTVPNKLYGLTQNEDHTKAINDLGDLDKDNTFEVPCFQFDEAGHILEARTHTVTLPEIYNKFIVSAETAEVANMDYVAGTITADNMNDTVTFTPGNKWIHMAVSGTNDENTLDTDVIKIAHEVTAFNDGEANKEYGLLANETISDANNSFEIPAFKFDEAGHIRGARTHTLTLPYGFTNFKTVLSSIDNKDKTEGTVDTIKPNTMTDTLTLTEGNKWICIDGNDTNNDFTFSHYVSAFNEGTATTDLDNSQTFTVQELVWDRAGHLTGSTKKTYTLQDGFKNLVISNTGNASVATSAIAANGTLIADTQVDTATIDAGNRWLTFVANGKKVSMYHASAGAASTSKGDAENQTPVFGSTFKALSVGIDQAGHVSSLEEHTVQIPKPSLNNDIVGGTASVLTKLSLEDTTGAFSTEHKNIGELLITGYSVASNVEDIVETDSINSAFGKVQKALNILNSDNTTENSIDYKVKNAIDDLRAELQDNCDEEFKTFKLIQDQITDDSEETIVNRVKTLEEKSLPEYKDLEDESIYLMKMVNGNPTWVKLESWNGGKY